MDLKRQKQNLLTLAAMALCFGFSACVIPDKDKTPQAAEKVGEKSARPQASIEAKQLAAEQEASTVTELNFAKGQTKLSAEAEQRLKRVAQKIKNPDQIEKVVVVAWADQEYPSERKEELPEAAKRLAKARGDAITRYLDNNNSEVKMEVHNMAEQPGALEKFMSSSDARVKESLEISGINSKVSKAMVLVVEKD